FDELFQRGRPTLLPHLFELDRKQLWIRDRVSREPRERTVAESFCQIWVIREQDLAHRGRVHRQQRTDLERLRGYCRDGTRDAPAAPDRHVACRGARSRWC